MATITYAFVRRCDGGGHTALNVSYNGGANKLTVYDTDQVRAPLSELTEQERETFALLAIKVHFAGKTRQQIVTEFNQGPVTVTI